MRRRYRDNAHAVQVLVDAVYLAWKAQGDADRSRADVWQAAYYSGPCTKERLVANEAFGRRLGLQVFVDGAFLITPDYGPLKAHHPWKKTYGSYERLFDAAESEERRSNAHLVR